MSIVDFCFARNVNSCFGVQAEAEKTRSELARKREMLSSRAEKRKQESKKELYASLVGIVCVCVCVRV